MSVSIEIQLLCGGTDLGPVICLTLKREGKPNKGARLECILNNESRSEKILVTYISPASDVVLTECKVADWEIEAALKEFLRDKRSSPIGKAYRSVMLIGGPKRSQANERFENCLSRIKNRHPEDTTPLPSELAKMAEMAKAAA